MTGWTSPWPTSADDALVAGAVLVVAVRATAGLAEARMRVRDWPLWRSGAAVPGVALHDVAVGLAGYLLLAVLPVRLLLPSMTGGAAASGAAGSAVAGAGLLISLLVSGRVLRRRRGFPLAAVVRPRALTAEPVLTARGRLLVQVERNAGRASARWISGRLARCRKRAAVPDDELLPAVWTPGRLRLRESVGVGRTEVALLLLQAQSVVDDASPATERLLALLHLIHDRAGRRGVRAVLDEAVREPLGRIRPGVAPWGSGPDAVPPPAAATAAARANPFPKAAAPSS